MGFVKRHQNKKNPKKVAVKSRKEIRKTKRQEKKARKALYYEKKSKKGKSNEVPDKFGAKKKNEASGKPQQKSSPNKSQERQVAKPKNDASGKTQQKPSLDKLQQKQVTEKRKMENLKKEMSKIQRRKLVEDNMDEDRMISSLEKKLKLNKRKSKTVPKSFAADGLDYILDFCDEENRKAAIQTERQLWGDSESERSDSEEKSKVHKDSKESKNKATKAKKIKLSDESESRFDSEDDQMDSDEEQMDSEGEDVNSEDEEQMDSEGEDINSEDDEQMDSEDEDEDMNSEDEDLNLEGEDVNSEDGDVNSEDGDINSDEEEINTEKDGKPNINGEWEDIYGRKRDKDGNILSQNTGKYIPPAARLKNLTDDPAKTEKLQKLRRQLKGLLNKLAEHNMHAIVSEMDELYMSNSRHDMNEMLSKLIIESLVAPVLTPDRLIAEHMMSIAILHANVGTEVGAHFLLTVVKRFDEMMKNPQDVENKEIDNVILMIAHLYNFKVFGSDLVYQILNTLSEKFTEKEIELILLILKTVGLPLRKENPLALKELILNLNEKARASKSSNTRVQFMLDILTAIKNNNMNKIPQYDPSHVEHLKKVLKSFIRTGNSISQLNISLEDLLKVEERGKWWLIGSAWAGNQKLDSKPKATTQFSFNSKILELAQAQKMNTDVRKNIFGILMTAEDYLDAFEKLDHLGLKNQQEQEIIHVIIHCCLQERKFNSYYAVLAQKFCEYDRKFQMAIKYNTWTKLKTLHKFTDSKVEKLAKFLSHLFNEKGLPLSILKVIELGELDVKTMKLLRQIILDILLQENDENCLSVFTRIVQSEELHHFRENLRLFIAQFLKKKIEKLDLTEVQTNLLTRRIELIDKCLGTKQRLF